MALTIRQAVERDSEALGRLGAMVMRAHHAFDSRRFMSPGSDPEKGYAWFLSTQLGRDDAAVLVAERDGMVVGYVYAGLEPLSWKELRDGAGFIHDIAVDESARGAGVASALTEAAFDWLRTHGAPRVLLWTAEQNTVAQRVFTAHGFRRTMIEMTREL